MDQNNWRVILDPLGDGAINMAKDRAILIACNEGEAPATLRLYGWQKPTLSIGYSQDVSKDINLESCEQNRIPVVRRFTGGRALLHQYELTYSVVAPIPHKVFPGSLRGAFEKISQAILESLKLVKIEGVKVAGKKDKESGFEPKRFPACFSVASHCEIAVEGKKLIGSAQRRLRSAFLQHGSIILDMNPKLTHTLLKYPSEFDSQAVLKYLMSKTITLKQILKRDLEHDEVAQWFLKGFQKSFSGNWNEGQLNIKESNLLESFLTSQVKKDETLVV